MRPPPYDLIELSKKVLVAEVVVVADQSALQLRYQRLDCDHVSTVSGFANSFWL